MNDSIGKLNKAGVLLLKLVHSIRQADGPKNYSRKIKDEDFPKCLEEIRTILRAVDHTVDPHKYAAVTNALNAFNEIGHDFCSKAHLEMFRGHVEAIEGGIRSFNLGGKRTNNKLSADRNYLRAAAIVLWKYHTQRKDNTAIEQLVSHARSLLGIGTKPKLAKMVSNFEQKHDIDVSKSKSPLSVHFTGIEDLVNNYGYKSLKDFA
jgi:hypothetical protein